MLAAARLPLLLVVELCFHSPRSRRAPLQARSLPILRRSRQNRQSRQSRRSRRRHYHRRRRKGNHMSPATTTTRLKHCRRRSAASRPPSPQPGSALRPPGPRGRPWRRCDEFHLDGAEDDESQKRKKKKRQGRRRRRRLSIGQSDAVALPFSSLFSTPQRDSAAEMVPVSSRRASEKNQRKRERSSLRRDKELDAG